jgi:YD repeat-containing protein
VELGVLGPLKVNLEDRSIVPSATKPRKVLALLLVNAGRMVPFSLIKRELWDDDEPSSSSTTLQTYILQLRKNLGPASKDVIVTKPRGYAFLTQGCRLDLDVYEELVREGYAELDKREYRAERSRPDGHVTRDVLGRVTERRSDDDVTTLAYDAADRIMRATNQDADVVSSYDPLGRLVTQTTNGRAVSNTYDAVGRRIQRITPSGAETSWRYNLSGQLTSVDTASRTLEFTYDPAGRETSRRVGAVMLAQTWDANHCLRTQAVTAPGPAGQQQLLQRRAYTYRADDSVTNIVDQLAGVRHFDLDPLGRITQVVGASHRESYRYDASGNIELAGRPDPNPELAEAPGDAPGHRHAAALRGQRPLRLRRPRPSDHSSRSDPVRPAPHLALCLGRGRSTDFGHHAGRDHVALRV